jgi:hypothetical protein
MFLHSKSVLPSVVHVGSALTKPTTISIRRLATAAPAHQGKKEGDISSVFVSLSGATPTPLPDRFAKIKSDLIKGHEEQVLSSWKRLLSELEVENKIIAQNGPDIVPQIDFKDLNNPQDSFKSEVKKRGVGVIRGVVPHDEARGYKTMVEDYVKLNPWTKAFPQDNPAVFELYWSPAQVAARAHPNLIATQRALMKLWHSNDKSAKISTSTPLAYADRVRIRQPGDSGFALGPHVDGGSVERWEPDGYGRGKVYDKIWQGKWEEYDPFEASCRVPAVSDLYEGAGACSMFRMFQAWLSMSSTGPKEGTLQVYPHIKLSTAYFLLRPFFEPINPPSVSLDGGKDMLQFSPENLKAENWRLKSTDEMSSELHGANPSHAQELTEAFHPHLELGKTMVHVPRIDAGDYVVWHCDGIHAVDKVHQGTSDSSVLYIPVCPTTESNAKYLLRQRETFLGGYPGPDFPGGKGESEHANRPTSEYLKSHVAKEGLQAMGLEKLAVDTAETDGGRLVVAKANEILGY